LPDRSWSEQFDTIADAETASSKQPIVSAAAARGLTPDQHEADPNRVTLRSAVESYLEANKVRSHRTFSQYTFHLEEFVTLLPRHIRFLDQIDARVLQGVVNTLQAKGAAPKTIENKIGTVWFMLKHAGIEEPSTKFKVNLPAVEEEDAVPYTSAELKAIFDSIAKHYPADRVVFMFMLMTACRKGEVAHAMWNDIDWKRKEFIVRAKT
jgi:integrase